MRPSFNERKGWTGPDQTKSLVGRQDLPTLCRRQRDINLHDGQHSEGAADLCLIFLFSL